MSTETAGVIEDARFEFGCYRARFLEPGGTLLDNGSVERKWQAR